jgi:hypothetical protein
LCDGHEEDGFIHLLTSRAGELVSAPEILAFSRGHWGIETRVHYTRDANYHEDRCRISNPTAAHVCATLRSLANYLLGRQVGTSRRNTRRRQYRRIARHPGLAVDIICNSSP